MSKRLLICCICGGRQRIYLRKVALTPPLSNYSLSLGIATTFLLQWIARIQHRTTCTKLLRFCLSSEIHWKLGTKLQLAEKKGEYNCIDCTSTCHGVAPLKKYTQLTIKLLHKCKIGRVARSVQVQIKRTMKIKPIL